MVKNKSAMLIGNHQDFALTLHSYGMRTQFPSALTSSLILVYLELFVRHSILLYVDRKI